MKKILITACSIIFIGCQMEERGIGSEEISETTLTTLTIKDYVLAAQKYGVQIHKRDSTIKYSSVEDSLKMLSQPIPWKSKEQLEIYMKEVKENNDKVEKIRPLRQKYFEEMKAAEIGERNNITKRYEKEHPELFE